MSDIFEQAKNIAKRLVEAGHEAYFAGGCVRDRLLGVKPKDYDIATSAKPEEVEKLFRNTIGVGRHFGVMIVVDRGVNFDVATFRADGAYGDGRHPDEVHYSNAEEDVKRRDFTINGLLMDPQTEEVIDYVGGQEDLQAGVIRTIGDAKTRFGEDHLRILRAVRFACRLGFSIEDETQNSIRRLADRASGPSAERIFGELDRMLTEKAPHRALELLDSLGLLNVVLPEVDNTGGRSVVARLNGVDGSTLTVFERKLKIFRSLKETVPSSVAWAILLGDLSDASPKVNAKQATQVLRRLRASKALIDQVQFLIVHRDRFLFACRTSQARWRLLASSEDLQVAGMFYNAERSCVAQESVILRATIPEPTELPSPLLDGRELMTLGVPKGRGLGRAMKRMRFLQLNGRLFDKDQAEAWAKQRYLE